MGSESTSTLPAHQRQVGAAEGDYEIESRGECILQLRNHL